MYTSLRRERARILKDSPESTPDSRQSTPAPDRRVPWVIKRWRILVTVMVLALILAITIDIGLRIFAGGTPPDIFASSGKVLPPLPVVDGSGQVVDASETVLGKRSVIVFYSPSCNTCKDELPKLQPFPPALALILVNEGADASSSPPPIAGLRYDAVFYNRDGVLNTSFRLGGLPTILFVDEQGILRDGMVGSQEQEVVQKKLNEFAQH